MKNRIKLPQSNKRLFIATIIGLVLLLIFVTLLYLYKDSQLGNESTDAATTTYKKWEEITLDFTGSHAGMSQNSSNPNPYMDYRLTVTFTNAGKTFVVPGYFIGDGAGNTGNKWRAHFSANTEGTWNYTADLRSGTDVAVNGGGTSVVITPASGSFAVAGESSLGGFYSNCGRLEYVGKHYLQCAGTKQYWVKGGTNSPENFIAGADTGNEANIKTVIDYLSSQKVNSIYFLPNNIGGDGNGDTHPYVAGDTQAALFTYEKLVHFKTTKLNKWNDIFKYAMQKDISLEFVLNEQEEANRLLLGPTLTNQRKVYYRELVARYSHHPAVRWIITEENKFPNTDLKAFAGYIKTLDPYKHPIAVHTNVDSLEFYEGLLGDPNFDSASVQFYTIPGSSDNASLHVENWRKKSADKGRPWAIELDESILKEDSRYGMTKENQDDLRRRVLYPGYFSGGQVSWYYGYDQDKGMSLWKFQDREPMWKWMWYARKLLYEIPDITQMRPGDELITSQSHSGGKTQVFYNPGYIYMVYMAKTTSGENAKINLSSAAGKQLTMQWYNPRTGTYEGSAQSISPSSSFLIGASPKAASGDRDDWVVVFKSGDIGVPPGTKAYKEAGGLIVIEPENRDLTTGWKNEKSLSGYTGQGYIRWDGPDYFGTPGNGLIEYKIFVTNPGTYNFRIRANKTDPNPSEDNDVWTKANNAQWYKTFNSSQQINQWSFPTQYEIVHPTNMPPASVNLVAGLNSLYISGRSNGFHIDRIHLYKGTVANPESTSHPESEYADISTPTDLTCNSVCQNDTQCSTVDSTWYCAQQYNFGTWTDDSEYIRQIQYDENGTVKTDSGVNYGLNQYVQDGVTHQHLVKSNKVYYRKNTPNVGWDKYWTDATSGVSKVGCDMFTDCGGAIVGFNSYVRPDGKVEQHLLRRNSTSFKIFSRNNIDGWSDWIDSTGDTASIGSGEMTAFTSYVHRDGYILQNIVRGGRLWERSNLGGWTKWADITSDLNSCTGTGTNKCGSGKLISIERSNLANGNDILHIFREDNMNYSRISTPTDQRCRKMTNIWSNTCQNPATPTPTPVKTATPTPTKTPTPTPTTGPVGLCQSKTVTYKSGQPYTNTEITYTITLKDPAPAPNGRVKVNDYYSDKITILTKPTYCSQVAGLSDFADTEESTIRNTSLILLIIIPASIVALVLLRNGKMRGDTIQTITKRPLLSSLIVVGVIVTGGLLIYIIQEDTSPQDSPAAIDRFLTCSVPAGTKSFSYTAKIIGGTGQVVNNEAKILTGTTQTSTCAKSFTIIQTGTTQTPSPTPSRTPIPSNTPTVSISPTITLTPSPGPSPTPSITPSWTLPVTPSITPSETIVPSDVTPTLTPSGPIVGNICGPSDINGDGRFTIFDFGAYQIGFASRYKESCDDTFDDTLSYAPCGGKDVDRSGEIGIFDFQSFAQRYRLDSCAM